MTELDKLLALPELDRGSENDKIIVFKEFGFEIITSKELKERVWELWGF